MANAMGMARTHEFWIGFGAPEDPQIRELARTFLARPHVAAAPEWVAETRAVGELPMTARQAFDVETFEGKLETVLDRNFDWEMRRLAPFSLGKWVWGAAHSSWIERQGYWNSWRLFRNTHHGASKGYWYLFARSADRKYLDFARRSTEFIADVGMCHFADTDLVAVNYYGKRVGAVCDYKGYVPWHSGSRFGYNTYADHLLNWWYFTGHPRAKDTIEEMFQFYLSARRGSAGSGRAGASRFETACSLYAHTLDSRLLPYLNHSFETARKEQHASGFIPAGKEFGTWLPLYIELTEDPEALEVLRRWAYADVKQPWWYDFEGKTWQPNWATQAFAYERFRDPKLLGPGLARLQRLLDSAFLQEGHPEDGYIAGGNTAWSWLQQKIPSFLWALKDAGGKAEPLRAVETLCPFLLDDVWSTWAMFNGAKGDFEIRLRGRWYAEGKPRLRVLDGDGRVVHDGLLPHFAWKRLPLSNPPIEPDSAIVSVKVRDTVGPYRLQVRGEGGSVQVMLPLTRLPKEVYYAGDNLRRYLNRVFQDPGRFPQLANLQSCRKGFGQYYGFRRVYFFVPADAEKLDSYGIHFGFGRHSFRIEDTDGNILIRKAGFNRTKAHAVLLEGERMKSLRGKMGVFYGPCEKPRPYLLLGEDIPPYVSLRKETFFIPKELPAAASEERTLQD
jgi:hypothetical protein